MIKFKLDNKGSINQEFGGSPNTNPTQYTSIGVQGHTGIDTSKGWDVPVPCDNDGLIYKVILAQNSPSNWQAVYQLVDDGKDVVEVCYGHLNRVYVSTGQTITEGSYVGSEGNHGYVFSGATEITPAMQKAGDQRGHHLHTSYRPVKKVPSYSERKHYLQNADGSRLFLNGCYYEIINNDNGYNGCVNPRSYLVTLDDSTVDRQLKTISLLQRVVDLYKQLIASKK